jgi:hypothetical protein
MTAKRPVRKRLVLLPFVYKRWLLSARPGCLLFLERKRVTAMWTAFGEMITERHIRKWPGSRPANWWRFDAPERWNSAAETQLQYLQRLGLLSAEEKARVKHVRPRLRPEIVTQGKNSAQPLSGHQTAPVGWQLVLIDDKVELVRVKPDAGPR